MNSKEILDKVRNMTQSEKKNISYEELCQMVNELSKDEIIELSKLIDYPVFARLCMGELKHKFVLLQDGASAIIVNENNQILLQSRSDRDKWGLPGGCQELGERFEETIIREVKEETNLDVLEDNLHLISLVSGKGRMGEYPNGDVVINNTALYLIKNYTGSLKWDVESKEMRFFDIYNLPQNLIDEDLIRIYKNYINE